MCILFLDRFCSAMLMGLQGPGWKIKSHRGSNSQWESGAGNLLLVAVNEFFFSKRHNTGGPSERLISQFVLAVRWVRKTQKSLPTSSDTGNKVPATQVCLGKCTRYSSGATPWQIKNKKRRRRSLRCVCKSELDFYHLIRKRRNRLGR